MKLIGTFDWTVPDARGDAVFSAGQAPPRREGRMQPASREPCSSAPFRCTLIGLGHAGTAPSRPAVQEECFRPLPDARSPHSPAPAGGSLVLPGLYRPVGPHVFEHPLGGEDLGHRRASEHRPRPHARPVLRRHPRDR